MDRFAAGVWSGGTKAAVADASESWAPPVPDGQQNDQRLVQLRVLVDPSDPSFGGDTSPLPVRRLRLTGNRYTIGRGENCSIRIPDSRLRQLHAVLMHIRDRRDDGKTQANAAGTPVGGTPVGGTPVDTPGMILVCCQDRSLEVNGRSVQSATLGVGDMLRIGNHRFEVLSSSYQIDAPERSFGTRPGLDADPDAAIEQGVWRQRLQDEIERWQQRHRDVADRESTLDQVRRDLDQRRQKLDRRSEQLDGRLRKIDAAERGYQDQLETAKQRLDDSQRRADAATEAVARMREQFEQLNRQVDELTDQQSRHVEAQQIARDQHQEIRDRLTAERDEAIDRRSNEEAARQAAEEASQAANRQREAAESRAVAAAESLTIARQEVQRLGELVQSSDERNRITCKKLSAAEADSVRKSTDLQAAAEKIESTLAGLGRAEADAELARRDADQAAQRLVQLQQSLDTAEEQLQSKTVELTEAQTTIETLQQQSSELDRAVTEAKQQADSVGQLLGESQTRIEELESLLAERDSELEQIRQQPPATEPPANEPPATEPPATEPSDRESAKLELEQLRTAMDHLSVELAGANEQIGHLTAENEQLQEQIAQLRQPDELSEIPNDEGSQVVESLQTDDETLSHGSSLTVSQPADRGELIDAPEAADVPEWDDAAASAEPVEPDQWSTAVDAEAKPAADADTPVQSDIASASNFDDDATFDLSSPPEVDDDNPWPTYNQTVEVDVQAAGDETADENEWSTADSPNGRGDVDGDDIAQHYVEDDSSSDPASDAAFEDSSESEPAWSTQPVDENSFRGVSGSAAGDDSDDVPPVVPAASDEDWSDDAVGDLSISDREPVSDAGAGSFASQLIADLQNSDDKTDESDESAAINQSSDDAWDDAASEQTYMMDPSAIANDEPSSEWDDDSPGRSMGPAEAASESPTQDDEPRAEVNSNAEQPDWQSDWDNDDSSDHSDPDIAQRLSDLTEQVHVRRVEADSMHSAPGEVPAEQPAAHHESAAGQNDDFSEREEPSFLSNLYDAPEQPLGSAPETDDWSNAEPEFGDAPEEVSAFSGDEVLADEESAIEEPAGEDLALEHAAENDPADDPEDDSIEAYMNRLLGRVQGHSTNKPAADDDSSAGSSRSGSTSVSMSSVAKSTPTASRPVSLSDGSISDSDLTQSSPITDDTPIVPRSHAPEKDSNLSAMRQLANDSARDALSISTAKQIRQIRIEAIKSFAGAGVSLLIGVGAYAFSESAMLKSIAILMTVIAVGICLYQGWTTLQESRARAAV